VIRELLADYAHQAWSGWMSYFFSRCVERERQHGASVDPDDLVIPGRWVRRWQRQVDTSYRNLSEEEKASDLAEADKMLAIIKDALV
jgi:hypothetical protein